ncbi:MAG: ABC transporter ATP-binding protein [Anaerolineaceae bacterium]|nr:ABC transporter ATP-binding protein [Anaerolineaceae bacterium]
MPISQESVVVLDQLSVRLGGNPVLQDMSFTIQGGEFIVILGPNGAGKSTFLKLLLGLVRPTAGSIQVLGSTPQRGNQAIGYAPQHRSLDTELPLRARDLVGFGLDGHRWGTGWPSRQRQERIERALEEVDALALADAPVGRLSGGEQQRLLIAQALLTNPQLLLLDEPLANLDLAHQKEVVDLVSHLNRVHGVTVLLVAHDINPLLQVTDRVLYIARGHSCLGSPQEIITSDTLSNLYGSPVEVIRAEGRFFVVGAEI